MKSTGNYVVCLCNKHTLALAVRIQDNQKWRQFGKPESVTRLKSKLSRCIVKMLAPVKVY